MSVDVLVTGGGGFIGRFLVERLVSEGYSVLSISRSSSPFREHPRIVHYNVDIVDTEQLSQLFSNYKPRIVVHLAALLADACEADYSSCYRVNLDATFKLIELSIANRVEKFIFTSSAAVYSLSTPEPVKEEYANPVLLYGVTKYAGELLGLWFARKGLLDFRVIRPTVVFGPGRFRGPSAEYSSQIIEKALAGELVVVKNPEDRVNYVYVRDVVDAYIKLIEAEKAPSRVYNIGGFVCKVVDFVKMVEKYIPGLKYEVRPAPVTKYPAEVDISRATSELGWKPRYLFEKAIEDYIETVRRGSPIFRIHS